MKRVLIALAFFLALPIVGARAQTWQPVVTVQPIQNNTVTLSVVVPACEANGLEVVWGDGSADDTLAPLNSPPPGNCAMATFTPIHAYAQPGNYNVKLQTFPITITINGP